MDLNELKNESRMLIEVPLRPIQGTRFQPTGFPDLGAATYTLADGTEMLLVESTQSMANRMEEVCWNKGKNELVEPLKGIPYVIVKDENGKFVTNSILESHRINSPYILESEDKNFYNVLKNEIGAMDMGAVDMTKFANTILKYDLNCLLHGVFLAKSELAGGRLRLPRALSGFIEAKNVTTASSGGVKLDHVDPKGDSKKGFGHVPFHRDEYSGEITAYFNLDISQIRGYGLGYDIEDLLILLAIYKIRKVLHDGLRLRTACDLEVSGEILVKRPKDFTLPDLEELEQKLPGMIESLGKNFSEPRITNVLYKPGKGKTSKKKSNNETESEDTENEDQE